MRRSWRTASSGAPGASETKMIGVPNGTTQPTQAAKAGRSSTW